MQDIHIKLDELYKVHSEKKAILNIPVNFDEKGKGKEGGGGFDASLVIDALEKMRDYIASENKKIKEDFFKLRIELEQKLKEKLEKKDVDEIESKDTLILNFYRKNS